MQSAATGFTSATTVIETVKAVPAPALLVGVSVYVFTVATALGGPEIEQSLFRVKPAGKVPEHDVMGEHVLGLASRQAQTGNCLANATFTVRVDIAACVQTGVISEVTAMFIVTLRDPAVFFATTVYAVAVEFAVGVPYILQVTVSSESPAGSAGVMEQPVRADPTHDTPKVLFVIA